MTGAQAAAQARELRPEVKVLFTTGYARNAIFHHGRLDKGVHLITKTFHVRRPRGESARRVGWLAMMECRREAVSGSGSAEARDP